VLTTREDNGKNRVMAGNCKNETSDDAFLVWNPALAAVIPAIDTRRYRRQGTMYNLESSRRIRQHQPRSGPAFGSLLGSAAAVAKVRVRTLGGLQA
jgi:hypothetical protein